jgi:pimeloyl-ACP methyl ester carboxylesterase
MIAKNKEVEIYYEVLGDKAPALVLIEGIGYSSWSWFKQKEELPESVRLVIFDNRGVGKSSSPPGAYSMKDFVDDMQCVIEDSGIKDKIYYLGVSMGGMIAQEYYFAHKEKVKGLILANTSFGKGSVLPSPEVLKILSSGASGQFTYEGLYQRMRGTFSENFSKDNPKAYDEIVRRRLSNGDDAKGYMGQLYAVSGFDAHDRLKEIVVPTLVITGDKDIVVPAENASELHKNIPQSKLLVFKNAGHALCIERYSDFDKTVLNFIGDVEFGRFERIEAPEYV